jgi:hypothetical protein
MASSTASSSLLSLHHAAWMEHVACIDGNNVTRGTLLLTVATIQTPNSSSFSLHVHVNAR